MISALRKTPAPFLLTVLLLLLVWVGGNRISEQKAFWFDEILTLRVAESGLGAPMWKAMTAGFEFNPPAAYLAVKGSESVWGRGQVSSRLPFLLAGLLTLLVLFLFHVRHSTPWTGFWCLVFLLHTEAPAYFVETRGYIFVFCGATLALYAATSFSSRPLRFAAILGAVSLALLSHMWAILLAAVLGVTLLWEGFREKRQDWASLAALACAAPCALLYPKLASATRSVQFDNPLYHTPLFTSLSDVLERLPLLFLLLCLIPLATSQGLTRTSISRDFPWKFALGLLTIPFVVHGVTTLTGTPYMRRYTLLFTLGACLLLAREFTPTFEQAGKLTRGLLLALIAFTIPVRYFDLKATVRSVAEFQYPAPAFAPLYEDSAPILFASAQDLLPANLYASPALRPRFRFVADRKRAIQFTGSDGVDSALLFGTSNLHLDSHLISWEQLQQYRTPFWLIDSDSTLAWIVPALRSAGYRLEPQISASGQLLRVTPPPQ